MLTKSLLQCRACRLTWFPQGGAGAGCPACGGTEIGGTLELFHAGIALIVLALIGLFLRHGPLVSPAAAPVATASAIPVKQASAGPDRAAPVPPARVTAPARRTQVAVSTKKVKASKSKRRQKKAKTRSKHVQR